MVGKGNNKKSMAYVGNIVAFIKFLIENKTEGYNVYNYIDKPDFTMNELVDHVSKVLKKHIPATHFPLWLGMMGGYCFDVLAFLTRKKNSVPQHSLMQPKYRSPDSKHLIPWEKGWPGR